MVQAVVAQLSFEQARSVVESLATTEGRLVASAVVVLVALAAAVVVPLVVRLAGRTLSGVLPDQARVIVDTVAGYLPVGAGWLVVFLVRTALLFGVVVTLLAVWGLVDAALTVLALAGLSVPLLGQTVVTVGVLLAAYIVITVFEEAFSQFSTRSERLTAHQEEIIIRTGHVAVLGVAATGILTLWGLDLSGLLVGAGFLGIVVGLAARQTLGSILAGFVLMFSKPFAVGDWVEVADHRGIVDNITIMNTRLQTADGEAVYLPNDAVSQQPIRNFSSQNRLRLRVEVGVDYDIAPDRAEEIACAAIEGVDSVRDSPEPDVVPTGFGDSAVIFELRFWISDPTPEVKWTATTQVIHAVKRRFEAEDIKIPFPQRELSGRAETGGFHVRDAAPEVETPEEVESSAED